MYKESSVQKNKTHIIHYDIKKQTYHPILAKKPYLVSINKEK